LTVGPVGLLGLVIGGISFGFSGFAFAVFATSSLALSHPPQVVVPTVALVADTLLLPLLYEVRRELRWPVLREVPPFAPWSVVFVAAGLLTGSALLGWMSPAVGRVALGTVVLAFAAFQLFRTVGKGAPESDAPAGPRPAAAVGFAAGLLDGWLGTGGVVVAVALAARRLPREAFLASIGAYFLAADLLRAASYAAHGYWTWPVLGLYLDALPVALVSYGVGVALRRVLVSPRLFQTLVIGLLGLNGIALILRTLLLG
jgi:uncharacterized protein